MVNKAQCKYCRGVLREIALGFAAIGTASFQKPQPAIVCDHCDKTKHMPTGRGK